MIAILLTKCKSIEVLIINFTICFCFRIIIRLSFKFYRLNKEINQNKQNINKETKIPIPSFEKIIKETGKFRNKNVHKNKESIQKLNALNLEMSETFKQSQLKYNHWLFNISYLHVVKFSFIDKL